MNLLRRIEEIISLARPSFQAIELDRLERDLGNVLPLPKVVCLCGSTSFREAFEQANYDETLAGNIVLSVGCYRGQQDFNDKEKKKLDELHKRKIDLADEVFVLNVDGYIGDSTRSEIKYAQEHGKPVRYLQSNVDPQ